MSQANEFEKTNLSWQIKQWQQQIGEWIEARFAPMLNSINYPDWSIPKWVWELLTWLSWLGLALLLAWIGLQVWRFLYPYLRGVPNFDRLAKVSNKAERLTDRTVSEWLKRSQTFQQQGNFTEACRALYMAMLQTLNDAKLIPHQLSRTDGEYLQLLKNLPQVQLSQILISTHERLCFSGESISLETFDRCQKAYQAIEQQINSHSQV